MDCADAVSGALSGKAFRDSARVANEKFGAGIELEEKKPQQKEAPRFETFTAEYLRLADIPEPRWIVEDLLTEGLASLSGRPKHGKSWLALCLSIAVASGGKALGAYAIPQAGDVLFLGLEDNEARLKKRMGLLQQQVIPWPERLHFATVAPRMDGGFVEAASAWLEARENPALIVVDMYAKVAAMRRRKDLPDYDNIYNDLAPLQKLAHEYHVCILLVMHLGKTTDAEDVTAAIMGSTAYAGATVTNLVLRRRLGAESDATLSISSKDVEDEGDIALIFDKGVWTSRGNADAYEQSEARIEILRGRFKIRRDLKSMV